MVCASIPLLVEHLFVHEHVAGTVTHAEVRTKGTRAPVLTRYAAPVMDDERVHVMEQLERRRRHGSSSRVLQKLALARR